MNKVSQIVKSVGKAASKHGPDILTALGIVGMASSSIMAVKATPKAIRLIEEREAEKSFEHNENVRLTKSEVVKTCWKCYIPAVLTGMASAGCLICANSVSARRTTAFATAYKLSEAAFTEYQEKVVETIGEKKEQLVRDEIAKDQIAKNPIGAREIIITEKGNTRCYDTISGRYFTSDIETIRRAENILNKRLMDEMYISLNEFYYEVGLGQTAIGDDLGWCIDKGLIEFDFSAQMSEDDTPCLVVSYTVAPMYGYNR